MDERDALGLLASELPTAGDDAAVVGDAVLTTDMLHETTDFPDGVTRYTAGWRAVGASLSDVAATGAAATAAVAVYGAPTFDAAELRAFVRGARDVCAAVDAEYVGGDLDETEEFTTATTALGHLREPDQTETAAGTEESQSRDHTPAPLRRDGAAVGDAVCVTGRLGRTAAALRLFADGATDRGNELFRFEPRVAAGRALRPYATAAMDVSDGLARSLHQLADASDCGFAITSESLPIHPAVDETASDDEDRLGMATTVGEDFELLCTVPPESLADARADCPVALSRIGEVTASGVTLDGASVADDGWTHGN
ncbi:thiamine-phosphate kinase [Halobaculum sp. MBLA0147]|uniref:thiamine-phosphate kinase n=1 Tax=Halobaculum sp. MBLA0147 TaxID=3079934 RepID=UPI0035244B73